MEDKKIYLTKEGLEKIKKEYQKLQKIRESKTKEGVPSFSSEEVNPEYLVFQEDLKFLEDRMTEIKQVLKGAQLIKIPSREKQNIINLGAKVSVEADGGQSDEFEIVGSLEANPSLGKISNESPVGKALIGHKIGDQVMIQSAVKAIYKIKKIKYKF